MKAGVAMPSELGLREQNKLEKRQRIRAAASDLFSKHGYESATVRQIAKRAHVGLGTLFNYAHDKRDLVFLIFNEELASVTDQALRNAQQHRSLVDQLLDIYKVHYEYFSQNPALSRILLKELTFYSEGKQARNFQEIRGRLMSGIEKAVRSAQREQRIRSKEDPVIVARHIFFVCSGAIRWWIANSSPRPREGLADLKRLLELEVKGLQPAPPSRRRGSLPRLSPRQDAAPRRDGHAATKIHSARLP